MFGFMVNNYSVLELCVILALLYNSECWSLSQERLIRFFFHITYLPARFFSYSSLKEIQIMKCWPNAVMRLNNKKKIGKRDWRQIAHVLRIEPEPESIIRKPLHFTPDSKCRK